MGDPNPHLEERLNGLHNVEINANDQASNELPTNHHHIHPPRALKDYMYPSRTTQPTSIELPPIHANHFKIKLGVINMLPKFGGSEDPYLFIREFKEVCSTLRLQQLFNDSICLRLITFTLRDNGKKWLYGLSPNYIKTWDQLVMVFLEKNISQ